MLGFDGRFDFVPGRLDHSAASIRRPKLFVSGMVPMPTTFPPRLPRLYTKDVQVSSHLYINTVCDGYPIAPTTFPMRSPSPRIQTDLAVQTLLARFFQAAHSLVHLPPRSAWNPLSRFSTCPRLWFAIALRIGQCMGQSAILDDIERSQCNACHGR